MKKLNILLTLSFLLLPSFAFATSGACSGHGGVDCSAGAGSYGQAICNDGWTGSSVSYYSMAECQTSSSSSCPQPIITGTTESLCAEMQNNCTQEQAQEQTQAQTLCASAQLNAARSGGTGTIICTPPSTTRSASTCAQAVLCQAQLNTSNTSMQVFNTCIANQVQQSAQQAKAQQDAILNQIWQAQAQLKQLNLDKTCNDALATYNQTSGKCACETGFIYTNGKCRITQEGIAALDTGISASDTPAVTPSSPTAPAELKYTAVTKAKPAPAAPLKPSSNSILNTIHAPQATSTTATTSATLPQHKSAGFFNRVYGFIGSFLSLSWIHR